MRPSGRSFSGNAIVTRTPRFGVGALLSLGELSSATSGSLAVALRAAASELRGTVCWCGTSVSKHRRLVRHRCLSWRSDAVAHRPVASLGLPARVDFWSAGRMQRYRSRDETDGGSP